MLLKTRRLTTPEVQDVLKRGRSRRGVYLSSKHLATGGPLKTSVIVAKSVAKLATERNRLRRAVYHALTPFLGAGNVIIFVQKKPAERLQALFTEDLTYLLK